ncbi:MAG: hypothetical protein V2J10_10745, partial [Wenzhouxiangella sp.]|nr:hypothetical protein [Wenzhouxiangella sp.]
LHGTVRRADTPGHRIGETLRALTRIDGVREVALYSADSPRASRRFHWSADDPGMLPAELVVDRHPLLAGLRRRLETLAIDSDNRARLAPHLGESLRAAGADDALVIAVIGIDDAPVATLCCRVAEGEALETVLARLD